MRVIMKARYLLAALSLAALSSCATYNEMRMDPKLRAQKAADAKLEQAEEAAAATAQELPKLITPAPTKQRYSRPVAAPTKQKFNRRDTGDFMRPDSLHIPSNADLKETATSTEQPSGTPGLTVPSR